MNETSLLDLRPLSIAELFDRSFRLYRKNFGTFLGIMLLTQIPLFLFGLALSALTDTTPNLSSNADLTDLFMTTTIISVLIAGTVGAILSLIFTQVGAAALTKAIADSYLGHTIGFWEAFQRIGNTWVTLIFASIVASLIVLGLAIPVGIIFLIPCIGPLIGFVGFVAVVAIGNVLISLIPPVVVLEKKGVMDSIRRAWELAKLRFWWAFGYLFLLGLMSLLVISGPTALIQFLFETALGNLSEFSQTIVSDTASSLLTAVFMPIRLAAITLMYFDLRIRFEGFDLMVLAAADNTTINDASELTSKGSL